MKLAFYEKEITPPLGCAIPGYFSLRQATDVLDRLYAKAMVAQSGETAMALIAVDGCVVPQELRDAVAERVEAFTGIKNEHITVTYVHTHTGMADLFPELERINSVAREAHRGLFDVYSKLIADCAILAYYRLADVDLSYACGEVRGISFCRDYYMKNGDPQTNPRRTDPNIDRPVAESDPSLPILFVKDKKGMPLGALINFACHSDCVDGTRYTGDFSSILSKELKKQFGEDFVSLFLYGPAGNINHFDVTKESDAPGHYVMMGKTLAGEALKALAKAKPITDDTLSVCGKYVTVNRMEIPSDKLSEAEEIIRTTKWDENAKISADGTDPTLYNLAMARTLVNAAKFPKQFNLLIQAYRIGTTVIYSLPGEPYNEFGQMIRKNNPTDQTIIATMSNIGSGYLPTRDMFFDSIYPSRIGANKLEKEAGYLLVDHLDKMVKSLF